MSEDGLTVVIRELIEKHYADLDALRTENRRLVAANEELTEAVNELRAMLERQVA